MVRLTNATFTVLIAIGLAACRQTAPSAPLRGAQPNGAASPVRSNQATSAVRPAETACLAAVASKVGKDGVSTIGVIPSQAATSGMVRVPGLKRPGAARIKEARS